MALTRVGLVLLLSLAACTTNTSQLPKVAARESITVTSLAFQDGGRIPAAFTCDGQEAHPPLEWSGGPPAEEFVLFMVDKDASEFVHWVVYGIPGTVTALQAGAVPPFLKEGLNSFGKSSYGGPCPPRGDEAHHYVFTVYSLRLAKGAGLQPGASLDQVVAAVRCCVQAVGSLSGTYGG